MEAYDYRKAVKDDIRDYIEEHEIRVTASRRDEIQDELYDELFCDDSVTGNASGSYTFSTWQAEEYLRHNIDLLADALHEFGENGADLIEKGAEACDVTIRCYLLSRCLAEVLDELEEDDEEDEDDEDDEEENEKDD